MKEKIDKIVKKIVLSLYKKTHNVKIKTLKLNF